jgi:hypothetical protein
MILDEFDDDIIKSADEPEHAFARDRAMWGLAILIVCLTFWEIVYSLCRSYL